MSLKFTPDMFGLFFYILSVLCKIYIFFLLFLFFWRPFHFFSVSQGSQSLILSVDWFCITHDFTYNHNLLTQVSHQFVFLFSSEFLYDLEESTNISKFFFFFLANVWNVLCLTWNNLFIFRYYILRYMLYALSMCLFCKNEWKHRQTESMSMEGFLECWSSEKT